MSTLASFKSETSGGASWYLGDFLIANTANANPSSIGSFNLILIAFVNGFEQFSAGLGTAVLTVYLLKSCVDEFKTAHFALVTGLMNIIGVFAGITGGIITTEIGYMYFFMVSFIAAIPGIILLYYIPYFDGEKTAMQG